MSQVIDVTGLSEPVINDLRRLVETLRTQQPEPPRTETPEERAARFREWAASHAKLDVIADDSRESIYEGRGE